MPKESRNDSGTNQAEIWEGVSPYVSPVRDTVTEAYGPSVSEEIMAGVEQWVGDNIKGRKPTRNEIHLAWDIITVPMMRELITKRAEGKPTNLPGKSVSFAYITFAMAVRDVFMRLIQDWPPESDQRHRFYGAVFPRQSGEGPSTLAIAEAVRIGKKNPLKPLIKALEKALQEYGEQFLKQPQGRQVTEPSAFNIAINELSEAIVEEGVEELVNSEDTLVCARDAAIACIQEAFSFAQGNSLHASAHLRKELSSATAEKVKKWHEGIFEWWSKVNSAYNTLGDLLRGSAHDAIIGGSVQDQQLPLPVFNGSNCESWHHVAGEYARCVSVAAMTTVLPSKPQPKAPPWVLTFELCQADLINDNDCAQVIAWYEQLGESLAKYVLEPSAYRELVRNVKREHSVAMAWLRNQTAEPAKPPDNDPPAGKQTYTFDDLLEQLGICNDTINKYLKQAGLKTTTRGKPGLTYAAADVAKLCREIINTARQKELKGKAKALQTNLSATARP